MDEGSLDLFVFINLCQWLALALCKSSCRVPQLFVKWELGLLPNHRFCKIKAGLKKKIRAQVSSNTQVLGLNQGRPTYHFLLEPGKNRTVLFHSGLRPSQVAATDCLHLLAEAVLQELGKEPERMRRLQRVRKKGVLLCLELLAAVEKGEKLNFRLLGGLQRVHKSTNWLLVINVCTRQINKSLNRTRTEKTFLSSESICLHYLADNKILLTSCQGGRSGPSWRTVLWKKFHFKSQ